MATGVHRPSTLIFNRPIRDLLPQMNRQPININADDECHEALKACLYKYHEGNDTHKDSISFPIGSTVAVQHEDGG